VLGQMLNSVGEKSDLAFGSTGVGNTFAVFLKISCFFSDDKYMPILFK
jgi:hypothetical protein